MAQLGRRHPRVLFPDLSDAWAPRLPFTTGRALRVEDYVRDGNVLRAELPGPDPEKDVEGKVEAGTLTILQNGARSTPSHTTANSVTAH